MVSKEREKEYQRRYREKHRAEISARAKALRAKLRAEIIRQKNIEFGVLTPLTIKGQISFVHTTTGHNIPIDAADFDLTRGRKWYVAKLHGKPYVVGRRRGKSGILLHRLLVNAPRDRVVDHKNGNTFDNRRGNLRICTQTYNNANQHKVRGTCPFKGVCFNKQRSMWFAQARLRGKNYSLGHFDSPIAAAEAYDRKAVELFGEFARTNESLGLLPRKDGSLC